MTGTRPGEQQRDRPEPGGARLLLSRIGLGYFPLSISARLPFAMIAVGVLTLVVAARGSIELGGINAAVTGLGCACFGPLLGAAADRFGQRPALLLAGAANSVLLGLFAWIAFSPVPDWAMLLVAFLVGASAPQTSPMSRSRLVTIILTRIPAHRQPRLISSVLALETAADEVLFTFGPVIVGILATTVGAWAPVAGAAVLTGTFVTAFALHRTSTPPKSREERARTLAPASELARPSLLITVFGAASVGLFFGTSLTALTAFLQQHGAEERAGLIYGALGAGSAVVALAVTVLPARFSLRARWLGFAALIVIGAVLAQFARTELAITGCLLIMGLGIGPTLVTLYNLGSQRSPEGRSATVMTMLGSAITVGQSVGAAVTGIVAGSFGPSVGMVLPLVAALLVSAAGGVNWGFGR